MKTPRDIFTPLKKRSLAPGERALLTQKIAEYRAMKPLSSASSATYPAMRAHTFNLFALRSGPVFASFMLFTLVGVSGAAAAEGAVPGDLLYPVKTAVTERARLALALDLTARAEVEAWQAERRLEEARTLAKRGTLTDVRKTRLEEAFTRHAASVEERVARIALEDPARAAHLATRFETSLTTHETLLASLDTTSPRTLSDIVRVHIERIGLERRLAVLAVVPGPRESVGSFEAAGTFSAKLAVPPREEVATDTALFAVSAAPEEAPSEETRVEPAVDQEIAARFMYARAEESVREAASWFRRSFTHLDTREQEEVAAKLADARTALATSRTFYADGLYADAFLTLEQVVATMNELTVLLKNSPPYEGARTIRTGVVEPADPLPTDLPLLEESTLPVETTPPLELRGGVY